MQISSKVSLLALASVATCMVVKRDPPLVGVINNVDAEVKKLDTAVKDYNGNTTTLLEATDALIASVKQGITTLDNSPSIDTVTSTEVLDPTLKLDADAHTIYNDISKQIGNIPQAQCSAFQTRAQEITVVGPKLTNLALSKLQDPVVRAAATPFGDDLIQQFKNVYALFTDGKCGTSS